MKLFQFDGHFLLEILSTTYSSHPNPSNSRQEHHVLFLLNILLQMAVQRMDKHTNQSCLREFVPGTFSSLLFLSWSRGGVSYALWCPCAQRSSFRVGDHFPPLPLTQVSTYLSLSQATSSCRADKQLGCVNKRAQLSRGENSQLYLVGLPLG